jgi:hypothetical protein
MGFPRLTSWIVLLKLLETVGEGKLVDFGPTSLFSSSPLHPRAELVSQLDSILTPRFMLNSFLTFHLILEAKSLVKTKAVKRLSGRETGVSRRPRSLLSYCKLVRETKSNWKIVEISS